MCVYLFAPSRGQPLCFSLLMNLLNIIYNISHFISPYFFHCFSNRVGCVNKLLIAYLALHLIKKSYLILKFLSGILRG